MRVALVLDENLTDFIISASDIGSWQVVNCMTTGTSGDLSVTNREKSQISVVGVVTSVKAVVVAARVVRKVAL